MITLVTCLFDINREKKGDGRSMKEYLEWFGKTLKIKCPMFIVTEEKYNGFVCELRGSLPTHVILLRVEDLEYYNYLEDMKSILTSASYKNRVAHPDRVECVLPQYNIVQYSKFHCLNLAIDINHFNSEFFFWIDAGISRFFYGTDIERPYPDPNTLNSLNKNKFYIQARNDIYGYDINESFIWGAANLLIGTMFGGSASIVKHISSLVKAKFLKHLQQRELNNEQLILAEIWKDNKELFCLYPSIPGQHLSMFRLMSTI